MFDVIEFSDILRDLSCIKLSKDLRKFVLDTISDYQSNGSVPYAIQSRIRQLYSRYGVKIKELHSARERALKTNSLKRLNMTVEEADMLEKIRLDSEEKRRIDVGF